MVCSQAFSGQNRTNVAFNQISTRLAFFSVFRSVQVRSSRWRCVDSSDGRIRSGPVCSTSGIVAVILDSRRPCNDAMLSEARDSPKRGASQTGPRYCSVHTPFAKGPLIASSSTLAAGETIPSEHMHACASQQRTCARLPVCNPLFEL